MGIRWATIVCAAHRYPGEGSAPQEPRETPDNEGPAIPPLKVSGACLPEASGPAEDPAGPLPPALRALLRGLLPRAVWELLLCPFPANKEGREREEKGQACPGRSQLEMLDGSTHWGVEKGRKKGQLTREPGFGKYLL